MKSFIAIALVILTAVQSKAGQQLDLFPEIPFKEQVSVLKQVCAEEMGNGDCFFGAYDVATYDNKKALKSAIDDMTDACRDYQYDAETNWDFIVNNSYLDNSEAAAALKKLIKMKMVKGMFGFTPNEEQCSEPEYCSLFTLYVYLENGELIIFSFDFRT